MSDKDSEGIAAMLGALKRGYETGDFSMLFPYLADNCEFNTIWRKLPVVGKSSVISYFVKKGSSIAATGAFPVCRSVSLTDALEVQPGETKPVLLLTQKLGTKTNHVCATVTLDSDKKIIRIRLVDPQHLKT